LTRLLSRSIFGMTHVVRRLTLPLRKTLDLLTGGLQTDVCFFEIA
jgi:hypothetical protein